MKVFGKFMTFDLFLHLEQIELKQKLYRFVEPYLKVTTHSLSYWIYPSHIQATEAHGSSLELTNT